MSVTLEDLRSIADAVSKAVADTPFDRWKVNVAEGTTHSESLLIDKVAENTVMDQVARRGLPLNILSEEIGWVDNGYEETLVLDPIDGSNNAVTGVPMYTLSMAVGEKDLEGVRLALLRNLATGDEYLAEKGKGATKNGVPMHARKVTDPGDLFPTIYMGGSADPSSFELAKSSRSCRYFGCTSLEVIMVAEGNADAYVMNSEIFKRRVRVVDIAAAYLILKEAGGDAMGSDGRPFNMPFDPDARANFIAFGNREAYDHIVKRSPGFNRDSTFGIVINTTASGAVGYAKRVIEALKGYRVVLESDSARMLGMEGMPLEEMDADLLITIGGDGTILRALQRSDSPLLGINAGGVGFLAEMEPDDIEEGLKKALSGDFIIDERKRLSATYNGEKVADAINEIVIHTDAIAKIRRFNVYCDGRFVMDVRADGIIVSTSTGSTCYAMSLGAPLIDPRVECMMIVPMAAYNYSSRPFIVPIGSKITIESVLDRGCVIVGDGQTECAMPGGTSVDIAVSGRRSRFIRLNDDFFKVVREKLVNRCAGYAE